MAKHLCTIQYAIDNKIPIDRVLNDHEKRKLIEENSDANYSYRSLLIEALSYSHMTIKQLIQGWGGIKIIAMPSEIEPQTI